MSVTRTLCCGRVVIQMHACRAVKGQGLAWRGLMKGECDTDTVCGRAVSLDPDACTQGSEGVKVALVWQGEG